MNEIILFPSLLFSFFDFRNPVSKTHSQTTKLLGGNIVNGTVTGTVLDVATMGLA